MLKIITDPDSFFQPVRIQIAKLSVDDLREQHDKSTWLLLLASTALIVVTVVTCH